MANNPILRYGPPLASGITCALGVSGEFPNYTSGSAYTGTVSITGAQGATSVSLVDTWTQSSGGASNIPVPNGDFEAGGSGWSVIPRVPDAPPISPGFSIVNGAARNGSWGAQWTGSTNENGGSIDAYRNNTIVRVEPAADHVVSGYVRCTSLSVGASASAALRLQNFADAAGTQPTNSFISQFVSLNSGNLNTWINTKSFGRVGPYVTVELIVQTVNGTATVEFDDIEWDIVGSVPGAGAPAGPSLPAGFTIDTVTSPDRVRVQWPGIALTGNTVLLLNMNGSNGSTSFVDSSSYARSTTAFGNAQISTAQSKFGGASGLFDGSGDYVEVPGNSDFNISTGDWTIRAWVRLPQTPVQTFFTYAIASMKVADNNLGTTFAVIFGRSGSNNTLSLSVFEGGSAFQSNAPSVPLLANTWHHVAIAREGNVFRVYFDGVQVASETHAVTLNWDPTWPLLVGRSALGGSTDFAGNIDDFEFIKGTCVYPGGTSFSPPTSQATPGTGSGGASSLSNLGFEAGDVNYLKGYGWAITNAAPVDAGTWSAKYSGLGQSNIVHETLAPVTAGTSITASCRVSKGNNRRDFAGGAVLLQWFDANLAPLGFNVGNVVNTGTSAFQTSSVTATAPAGSAYVRLGASGTRDVKGRASDVVTVDAFSWNHSFTLGGSGGSGGGATPITGPIALTFRVQDAQGCSAVATRTITPLSAPGTVLVGTADTASNVTTYNLMPPDGSQAGDLIIVVGVNVSPVINTNATFQPASSFSGISFGIGDGVTNSFSYAWRRTLSAGDVSSGIPVQLSSGTTAQRGRFIMYVISAASIASPFQSGTQVASGTSASAVSTASFTGNKVFGLSLYNARDPRSVTAYPLPSGQQAITDTPLNVWACYSIYDKTASFNPGAWSVSGTTGVDGTTNFAFSLNY